MIDSNTKKIKDALQIPVAVVLGLCWFAIVAIALGLCYFVVIAPINQSIPVLAGTLGVFSWILICHRHRKERKTPATRYSTMKPDIARDLIKHEDTLINNRISWLLTGEGFMFAALGLSTRTDPSTASNLLAILSVVGIVVATSAMTTLSSASISITKIIKTQPKRNRGQIVGLQHYKWWQDILTPEYVYPLTFIVAWTVVSQINLTPVAEHDSNGGIQKPDQVIIAKPATNPPSSSALKP